MAEDLVDQSDGLARILQHHFGEQSAGIASEFLAEPGLDDLDEGEIRLGCGPSP